MKIKIIDQCPICKKNFEDMEYQAKFLLLGDWVCNDCYLTEKE